MTDTDLKREIQKVCSNIADLFDKVDEYVDDEHICNDIMVHLGRSMGALCTAKMLLFGEDGLEDPDKVCLLQYHKDLTEMARIVADSILEQKKIADIINEEDDDE